MSLAYIVIRKGKLLVGNAKSMEEVGTIHKKCVLLQPDEFKSDERRKASTISYRA